MKNFFAKTKAVAKKKPSGNKLNMLIARTNQLSTRVVGMQLTSGTLIAVALSMTQMSTGFVFIASLSVWYQIAAIAIIGCLLAILVESLTIGGLGAVREATGKKRKFLDGYYAMRREPTPQQIENKERKETEFDSEIKSGWWFSIVGMVISIILGDVFWHHLFEGLSNPWIVFPMSGMCAAVITLTFVRAELFSGMLLRTLRAILKDNHLMRTAVNVEPQNMQMDMLISAMATVREDEAIRQPIEDKIGRVVKKRLGGFADNFVDISEIEGDMVEGSISQARQISAPKKPRGDYHNRKAELQQYLADNPGAPVRQIADHFSRSVGTIQNWLDKNRAGL